MSDPPSDASSDPASTPNSALTAWFIGRLPAEWSAECAPSITADREEITIVLTLPTPAIGDAADELDRAEAVAGRIAGFREDTRERRMAVAREAEHRFQRKLSWGVRIGEHSELFTHVAAPVMTRLRQPERMVLDTLVASGVARSRSDALAWCVRLVGRNVDPWLNELRSAIADVERIRAQGPDAA
jgi:hypothetical protein